jgi:hypothetical protein
MHACVPHLIVIKVVMTLEEHKMAQDEDPRIAHKTKQEKRGRIMMMVMRVRAQTKSNQ